jgi:hypothetical protein
MPLTKAKPHRGNDGAKGIALRDDEIVADHSMAGKALAMLWYNIGARSLEQTQAVFAEHRTWRAA